MSRFFAPTELELFCQSLPEERLITFHMKLHMKFKGEMSRVDIVGR